MGTVADSYTLDLTPLVLEEVLVVEEVVCVNFI